MDNGMMPNAKRYTNRRRQWKRWQKLVSVLGCIVVFCTTYALIIPAITQERETFCGMEKHIHGEDCKARTVLTELVCTAAEGDGHIHNENCYTLADGHVHTDGCYELTAGHSHDENCYILTEGHSHSDGCYAQEGGHTHGDGCYEWSVICTAAEEEGHEHTEECQEQVRTLVCSQAESAPQTVLTCTLDETPAQQVLACDLEEAAETQVLVCTLEEAESQQILTCTLEEAEPHTHGAECYATTEQEGESTCSLQEHEHNDLCYSDPAADVENAAAWERSFAGLELTGLWAKDVLELAETQLGYQESIRNYVMSGDETKGYTRYGAWYGDPYGDWCAMFVSFCLSHAEVEGIPLNSNCQNWIDTLSGETLDLYRTKDNYEPRPGDLIFFDWTGDGRANHVGLVKSLEEKEEEEGLVLTTVEGNSSNRVRTNTYDIADESILGYGALPAYALEETTRDVEIYTDGSYTTAAEDGTAITVSGTIPKVASIRAYAVAPETELNVLCAYEISIILPDGSVFEPENGDSLNVNIQCGAIEEAGTTLEVYYIPEEGEPEAVDTTTTEEGVAFDADHFSTYAVVKAAETPSTYATLKSDSIPTGPANAYYHSGTYPYYQVSTLYQHNGGSRAPVETFVLVPMDEYGGQSWTPDSDEWSASGNHNYVVTYCADTEYNVSESGKITYPYKYPLSQTGFSEEQQKKLQIIMENAYPMISADEMIAILRDAGYTGDLSEDVMMAGVQKAIWKVTNDYNFTFYTDRRTKTSGCIRPISENGAGDRNTADWIYDFLLNRATSSNPGDIEVESMEWIDNGDGTFTARATLNRAVQDNETVTVRLSNGSEEVTQVLTAGTQSFSIVWTGELPASGSISLYISRRYTRMDVSYFMDDLSGKGKQDMISAEVVAASDESRIKIYGSSVDVTVNKNWVGTDASNAPDITVHLLRNGNQIDSAVLNEENGWSHSWRDLAKGPQGSENVYTVQEAVPAGYTSSMTSSKDAEGNVIITLTNTVIEQSNETSVAVEKVWEDGNENHEASEITVRLYANGEYTGKRLILNSENDWKGVFEGLPYEDADGNVIEYTVEEDLLEGYEPSYEVLVNPGIDTTEWKAVTALTNGGTYRFVTSDGLALASVNGNLAGATPDENSKAQQWYVSGSEGSWYITNAETGASIYLNVSGYISFSYSWKLNTSGTAMAFSDNKLSAVHEKLLSSTTCYVKVTSGSSSAQTSSSNGSAFTAYQLDRINISPSYTITITNTPVEVPEYELPETGGIGQIPYTAGGLLLMAAAMSLMYNQKKRRKEETASS